jgi:hypothetical protein
MRNLSGPKAFGHETPWLTFSYTLVLPFSIFVRFRQSGYTQNKLKIQAIRYFLTFRHAACSLGLITHYCYQLEILRRCNRLFLNL